MDIDLINEFCLKKHCVLPHTHEDNIENISRKHIGLHSARIMTPFMTLCSRMNTFNPQQLISQLYVEKKLIKIRCMRTTLHIAPNDLASIVHRATMDLRLAECNLFFKRNNINSELIRSFEDLLSNFLNKPQSADKIEAEISREIKFGDINFKKNTSKKILKYYWETGFLCYVNTALSWENEERKYALTQKFYPEFNLNMYDDVEAKEKLVISYIERFGPATLLDLKWWSGLNISTIKNIILKYKDLLKKIEINGMIFFILESEYDDLMTYKKSSEDWVNLLAYEDPALKGYYESRERYVDKQYYNLLFNQIGEVRASIIYNGKAIGVWEWDKKNKNIKLNYFTGLNNKIKDQVEILKKKYEMMLYPNQQILIWEECN